MAGTFKPKIALFDGAAEMRAHQANRSQTFLVMDHNGRNMSEDFVAILGVICSRTNFIFAGRRRIILVAEKTNDVPQAKQAGQCQKCIRGKP